MSAQLKQFLDRTGSLWFKGRLSGKPGGVFCTTSGLHGGKATTLLSMMIPLLHHGMLIVGVPPTREGAGKDATYYGPVATTGPRGRNPPREDNLKVARAFGRRLAETAQRLRE